MALIEMTVLGPPISHQCKDPAVLKKWKATVLAAALPLWAGKPLLTGRLKCTIMNFHEGSKPTCDDDNMVKPIRDALNGQIYQDDKQITYSETIQISINAPVQIRRGSPVLLHAYGIGDEFLYLRLDDAPAYIQLPG